MTSLAFFATHRITPTIRKHSGKTLLRNFSSKDIQYDFAHYSDGWKGIDDINEFSKPGKFQIQTFNKISEKGLARFDSDLYDVKPSEYGAKNAHAILLVGNDLQICL